MKYKNFTLRVSVNSENNWKGRIVELDNKYEFTGTTLEELEKKFQDLVDEYLDTPRIKTQFSIVYKNSTLLVTPLIDGRFSAVCKGWIFPLYNSLDELISKFQERVEEYIHSGCISIKEKKSMTIHFKFNLQKAIEVTSIILSQIQDKEISANKLLRYIYLIERCSWRDYDRLIIGGVNILRGTPINEDLYKVLFWYNKVPEDIAKQQEI